MPSTKPAAKPKKPETLIYEVIADGWCAGANRKAGDTLHMTETAAKYEHGLRRFKEPVKPAVSTPSKGK